MTVPQTPVPVFQLILFLDIVGNIHAEAPGPNGTRRKIDLPHDFLDRNPKLAAELMMQRDHYHAAKVPTPPSKIERYDPQLEREARIQKAREDHDRQWQTYLNSLSPTDREIAIAKRDAKLARAREAELQRPKDVWFGVALNHGTGLANRVISDPSRRPRVAKSLEAKLRKNTGTRGRKPFNPALVMKLDI